MRSLLWPTHDPWLASTSGEAETTNACAWTGAQSTLQELSYSIRTSESATYPGPRVLHLDLGGGALLSAALEV
ncbi:hypothetical protein NDU88_008375 [Pleurodeles waltl]|uniref:Uncharacterized protein n=1 Tax=Pleurodeles waltl TaxID=8319 RepID=A0AAV7N6X9_PLEWA|nr:hypothetical protein NDU88_008375 [Pleurodeles waltl]